MGQCCSKQTKNPTDSIDNNAIPLQVSQNNNPLTTINHIAQENTDIVAIPPVQTEMVVETVAVKTANEEVVQPILQTTEETALCTPKIPSLKHSAILHSMHHSMQSSRNASDLDNIGTPLTAGNALFARHLQNSMQEAQEKLALKPEQQLVLDQKCSCILTMCIENPNRVLSYLSDFSDEENHALCEGRGSSAKSIYSQQLDFGRGANERVKGVYTEYMTEDERVCNKAENSSAKSIFHHKHLIINLDDLIPPHLRAQHADLINKTIPEMQRNNSLLVNLTKMLSRPIEINSGNSEEKILVKMTMDFLEHNLTTKQIKFAVSFQKINQDSFISISQVTSSKGLRESVHTLLMSSQRTTEMVRSILNNRSSPPPQISPHTANSQKEIIIVSLSNILYLEPTTRPTKEECEFAKSLLTQANSGTILFCQYKGRALAYSATNKPPIFLSVNYIVLEGEIYFFKKIKKATANTAFIDEKTIFLTNVDTREKKIIGLFIPSHSKFFDSKLVDLNIGYFKETKERNPFKSMEGTGTNETLHINTHSIIKVLPTKTLFFDAGSYKKTFPTLSLPPFPIERVIFHLDNEHGISLSKILQQPKTYSQINYQLFPSLIIDTLDYLHSGRVSKSNHPYVHMLITLDAFMVRLTPNCSMHLSKTMLYKRAKNEIDLAQNQAQLAHILTDVVNILFSSQQHLIYKTNLLKIIKHLAFLDNNYGYRLNLSIFAAIFTYLYSNIDLSTNIETPSFTIIEHIIHILFKLDDFPATDTKFSYLYILIYQKINKIFAIENHYAALNAIKDVKNLMCGLCFVRNVIFALSAEQILSFINKCSGNPNLMYIFKILEKNNFIPPSAPIFFTDDVLTRIQRIMNFYVATTNSKRIGLFVDQKNSQLAELIESHRDNLCDMSCAQLDEILSALFVGPRPNNKYHSNNLNIQS